MKKSVFGRKLSRDKNERKALFTSLMSALVMEERIVTTEAKAKAIKADVEKLITKADIRLIKSACLSFLSLLNFRPKTFFFIYVRLSSVFRLAQQ